LFASTTSRLWRLKPEFLKLQVAQMRGALKRALPGAPARQTATLHVSLLRLAGGAAAFADPAARQSVQASCDVSSLSAAQLQHRRCRCSRIPAADADSSRRILATLTAATEQRPYQAVLR
jgi:hypothetical protein